MRKKCKKIMQKKKDFYLFVFKRKLLITSLNIAKLTGFEMYVENPHSKHLSATSLITLADSAMIGIGFSSLPKFSFSHSLISRVVS
jgi:hypothetical protein